MSMQTSLSPDTRRTAKTAVDDTPVVTFDRVEDVPAYVVAPAHKAFVDEFLAPRVVMKKAWNFDVTR